MTGYQGTQQARLVSRLDIPSPHDCWLWRGALTQYGYAQMRGDDGKLSLVHRVAYESFVEPIPEGMKIDHECHNLAVRRGECDGGVTCKHRSCCNPWHLVARTQAENLEGSVSNAHAREFCMNGHSSAEYRHRSKGGQTYCKKCRSDYREAAKSRSRLASQRARVEGTKK